MNGSGRRDPLPRGIVFLVDDTSIPVLGASRNCVCGDFLLLYMTLYILYVRLYILYVTLYILYVRLYILHVKFM